MTVRNRSQIASEYMHHERPVARRPDCRSSNCSGLPAIQPHPGDPWQMSVSTPQQTIQPLHCMYRKERHTLSIVPFEIQISVASPRVFLQLPRPSPKSGFAYHLMSLILDPRRILACRRQGQWFMKYLIRSRDVHASSAWVCYEPWPR